MERYGIPTGVDVVALREKQDGIFRDFNKFLDDEESQREVRLRVQIGGRIAPEHLDKQFTV